MQIQTAASEQTCPEVHTTQKTQQVSAHSLLLARIRKPLAKVELGELESPGGTRGHVLLRLEADLTSQPQGSTCL